MYSKGSHNQTEKNMAQYNACNVTLICFLNASQHHFVLRNDTYFNQTFTAVKQKGFKRFVTDYKQSYWCCVVLCREHKNPLLDFPIRIPPLN